MRKGNFSIERHPPINIALSLLLLVGVYAAIGAVSRTLEIQADTLIARDGGQTIEASGNVIITDGRSTIRAGHALYTLRDRRILLDGGVKIVTAQGDLVANRAVILLGKGNAVAFVEATGGVAVKAQQRVLRADLASYEVASESLVATGNVTLFVPPDLTAKGAELVAKGRQVATLTGRPRVENREGFIEGDRIEFREQTQTAYVRGNVVSVFQDIRISAGNATLLAKEGHAIFREQVRVTRPGRTLSAEMVTLYYRERRLVTEGPTNIRIEEEKP
jgi:lipopolysaccharide export system protein LptA